MEIVNTVGELRTEDRADELEFEVDHFNRSVINSKFSEVVCAELVRNYLVASATDSS
jgi:hypothetical protein